MDPSPFLQEPGTKMSQLKNVEAYLFMPFNSLQSATDYLITKCGHDVDVVDSCKSTPLMDAAKAGHVSLIGFLLEHGADPLAKVSWLLRRDLNNPTTGTIGPRCLTYGRGCGLVVNVVGNSSRGSRLASCYLQAREPPFL